MIYFLSLKAAQNYNNRVIWLKWRTNTMFLNFLGVVPQWVSDSFPIIRIIFVITLLLLAITMVVIVLAQEGHNGGTNVISGTRESFYSQNKNSTKEGRLKRLMTIAGIAFVIVTILYFVTLKIYAGQ
jgi:preprotein translocase subunit SecG